MSRLAAFAIFVVVVSLASPRVEAYALCGPQSAASAESTSEAQMESDSPKSAGPSGAQSISSCDGGSTPTTPSSLTTPSTSNNGSIFISWGGASSSSNFVYKLSESNNGDPYITAHTVSSTATNPLSVTLGHGA
jgi:hypothetical protein